MKIEDATPAQREAITTDARRVLVLAGPGSGKTATTIARIKRLIDGGVDPSGIVVLTFTNAAARELEARLRPEPVSPTSAALAEVLVGKEGVARMNEGPYARLGHCGTLHSFCLRQLKEHGGYLGYGPRMSIVSPESAADLLASKATTLGCKTTLKELLALKAKGRPARGTRLDLPRTVVASYFDDLREAGIVDFDVLLTEALELFANSDALRGFTHLFVDEVQDSSSVDWAIYEALDIPNKFFVGDPDQAIYSFRGGDVSEVLDVAGDAATTVIKLEENFRSRAEVCDAANNLIARNRGRVDKRTISAKGPGGAVLVLEPALNEGEEMGAVVRKLNELPSFDPSEVAILARTNAIAAAFRKTLAATGVPVIERETSDLPRDWPFARALVELLANPDNDTLAFFYLAAYYQKRGASAKEARDSAHAAKRAANASGKTINEGTLKFERIERASEVPTVLSVAGLSIESRALVAEKLKELPAGASVLDLALAMAGTREVVREGSGEGINVLTIHASKGREFDLVFLVGFEDEILPGRRANVDVEEERRLAFVGLTRAREIAVLSSAQSRVTPWGAINPHSPSRFVAEILRAASCLALFAGLVLGGCASAPTGRPAIPNFVDVGPTRYLAVPLPIDLDQIPIKEGDWLLYRDGPGVAAGKVVQDRGGHVYKVTGLDGRYVSSVNYLARLMAPKTIGGKS